MKEPRVKCCDTHLSEQPAERWQDHQTELRVISRD